MPLPLRNKIIVIGKGRFGTAIAQGLREGGFVEHDYGTRVLCEVVQVSASEFTRLAASQMAHELQGATFVAYCGTKLPKYATTLASALQLASKKSSLPERTAIEFIDFSNPDPLLEKADVSGAIDLWVALHAIRDGYDEELVLKNEVALIKVSKVTEVGSIDASGAIGNTDGLVYSSHPGHIPRIFIPNLVLKSAGPNADLYEEARSRIHERSGIDCWHDGNMLGLAIFAFTSAYAIVRYDKNLNGVEPHANIPMYLLDKAFAWTGLWMVAVSPFAGNLLTLCSIYQKWSTIPLHQQLVALFCSLLMILPTILFSICWFLWIVARNMHFSFRWPVSDMYLSQSPTSDYPSIRPSVNWLKASLVDMVSLKGETGVVGFVYALVHSFLGVIVADVAYKTKWFVTEEQDSSAGGDGVGVGRMDWEFELSMTTGALGTALLWAVAMRSIMGKASWIRLKPMYAYVSPIAIWFSTIHVIAFGAQGWYTLFNPKYHNGQLSITFVSSMFPTCILLVHHTFSLFGTKKYCACDHLWKHSIVNIATEQYTKMSRKSRNTMAENNTAVSDSSETNSEHAFYSFVYSK